MHLLQLHEVLTAFAAEVVDVRPLFGNVLVFQTGKTKKAHLDDACPAMRNGEYFEDTVPVSKVGEWLDQDRVCSRCSTHLADQFDCWVALVSSLDTSLCAVQGAKQDMKVLTDDPKLCHRIGVVKQLVTLCREIDALTSLPEEMRNRRGPLPGSYDTIVSVAVEALSAVRDQLVDVMHSTDETIRAEVINTAGLAVIFEHSLSDLAWRSGHNMLSEWMLTDMARDQLKPFMASEADQDAMCRALWERDVDKVVDALPWSPDKGGAIDGRVPVFNGGQFARPLDWVAAEYRHALREVVTGLLDEVADTSQNPGPVVIVPVKGPRNWALSDTRMVIATVAGLWPSAMKAVDDGPMLGMVAVPRSVGEMLSNQLGSYWPILWDSGPLQEVLDVAVALWHDDPDADPAELLETARAALT